MFALSGLKAAGLKEAGFTFPSPAPAQDGLWSALTRGWPHDVRRYSQKVAAIHGLRRLPALLHRGLARGLITSPALGAHARLDGGDPLFCLSHRHYLIAGLGPRDRMRAALCHYRQMDQMLTPAFRAAVLSPDGLELWSAAKGPQFSIALCQGRDVTCEGGLSVVLRINGAPLSVLSFAFVPATVLGLAGQGTVPLLTRRQNGMDPVARDLLARGFDRVDPAAMTFAAFSAFVRGLGHDHAIGIRAACHPACTPQNESVLTNAYDGFWASLSAGGAATAAGPYGWRIALPAQFSPLDGMSAAKRARALKRRAHLACIDASASAILASYPTVPTTAG